MSYVVSFPRQIDNDIRLCPDVGIWSPDNLKSSKYQHPLTLFLVSTVGNVSLSVS